MRKKRIKSFLQRILAVFFAMALLAGCAKPDAFSAPADPEKPEPETERTEIITPEPTAEPAFDPERYAVEGQKGLYDLLPVLEREGLSLLHAGFTKTGAVRLFFTASSGSGLTIEDFDLVTGLSTVLYSEEPRDRAPENGAPMVYASDPPVLHDFDTDELILFSSDCASFTRYPLHERSLTVYRWDGRHLLLFDSVGEKLIKAGPDGTETVLIGTDYHYQIHSLLSVSEDLHYAALLATDNYTGVSGTILFDLTAGTVLGRTNGETHLCFSENGYATLSRIYDWDDEGNTTKLIFRIADTLSSDEVHEVRYEKEDSFPMIASAPGGYLIEDWDTGYTLYRADASGEKISKIDFPMERYVQEAETYFAGMAAEPEEDTGTETEDDTEYAEDWGGDMDDDWSVLATPQTFLPDASDGRYVLTEIRFGGETKHLLLWDSEQGEILSDPGITMNEPLFEQVSLVKADYGVFAERVGKIRDNYGITVLLDSEADLKLDTHTTTPALISENAEGIDRALAIIESALSEYPPGFFEKLSGGDAGKIVIELCDTIRAKDAYALDYPSALTCTVGEIRLLAFDVAYLLDMRYSIFHEISHMIDRYLEGETMAEDDPFWDEEKWNGLNPDGFEYYYAYNDENGEPYDLTGSDKHTGLSSDYWKKKKTGTVYFIDIYSKTFPTEDRAVLLGTLLCDDSKDELLSCPHILEKLQYYSEAIRRYFDPDGTLWAEQTAWERRISQLESGEKKNAA